MRGVVSVQGQDITHDDGVKSLMKTVQTKRFTIYRLRSYCGGKVANEAREAEGEYAWLTHPTRPRK